MSNQQIRVVSCENSRDFQQKVNALLAEGWRLHGEASIQTVSQQDNWDGRLRCWKETTYSQVLRKD